MAGVLLAAGTDGLHAQASPEKVTEAEIATWWGQLGQRDAAAAMTAIGKLTQAGCATVDFAAERLHPVEAPANDLRGLIGQLDDERFATREQAFQRLDRLGSAIAGELEAALARAESPEVRSRLRRLVSRATLSRIRSNDELQTRRAIGVLERIGTPEAQGVLSTVAGGAPRARQTVWAAAALQRLTNRQRLLARKTPDKKPATLTARGGNTFATPSTVYQSAFSPDGKYLATAGGSRVGKRLGYVVVWDVASGEQIRAILDLPSVATSLAFSPDGRHLAAAGGYLRSSSAGSGWVNVWDLRSGEPVLPVGDLNAIYSVAFSPDGGWLAAGGYDGTVRVWELATGGLALPPLEHKYRVYQVTFSPEGRFLASGVGSSHGSSSKGWVYVWELASGRKIREIVSPKGPVFGVAYSPDGRLLATGHGDNTVRLWERDTGQIVRTLRGHSYMVYSVAFSSDGRRVASAGYSSTNGTLRVWDTATGTQIGRVDKQNGYRLAFGPQGNRLVNTGTKAQIWELE